MKQPFRNQKLGKIVSRTIKNRLPDRMPVPKPPRRERPEPVKKPM